MVPKALLVRCVCKHIRHQHANYNSWCNAGARCYCNEYKQDNLQLIEDLAKERNLI